MLPSALVSLRGRLLLRTLGPALALLLALPAGAASFPPRLRFRSVSTSRVTVHYHQGLEALAREAAALADEILAAHESRYGIRVGRVQVVLADVEDDPNGFAIAAALPAGARARGGARRQRRVRELRRLAAPGAHRTSSPTSSTWSRRTASCGPGRKVLRPGALPLPQRAHAHLDDRGAGHLRGDGGHRLRARAATPTRGWSCAWPRWKATSPARTEPVPGLDRWPGGQAAYLFGEALPARPQPRAAGPGTAARAGARPFRPAVCPTSTS